jgi:hypothetical protein
MIEAKLMHEYGDFGLCSIVMPVGIKPTLRPCGQQRSGLHD